VREVYIDDETKEATVVVPNDQLALAIGKEGLNARLATRLTGWKIDIQSEQEFAQAEAELAYAGSEDGEEFSGRCAAVLSNGKRCPNAALPGSRYCGVPAHQALANQPAAAADEPPADDEDGLEVAAVAEAAEEVGEVGAIEEDDAGAETELQVVAAVEAAPEDEEEQARGDA
jgi:N utilization substance protein A